MKRELHECKRGDERVRAGDSRIFEFSGVSGGERVEEKPALHGPPIDSYCWVNAERGIFGATGIRPSAFVCLVI